MQSVLFVCHGNICRSPMAEFVLKDMVKKAGLSSEVEVASAATSTEEIGNPVHPGTRQKLAQHGISCKGKTACRLTRADYDAYDYLIGMDSYNLKNIHAMLGGDPAHKVSKLLSFVGEDGDIADPWYTGNFEKTYTDVVRGCNGLMKTLTAEIKHPTKENRA